MPFVAATDPNAAPVLRQLELRMLAYYQNAQYHDDWIRHANAGWREGAHDAQLAAASRIKPGSRLLEVGCGDTAAAAELFKRIPNLAYHGIDISLPAIHRRGLRLARAGGSGLPFRNAIFDVVISMFTIEHTTRPDHFLDEAWRVLRPGGQLLLIAPDFLNNAMASERIGFGYETGREKLRNRRFIDAAVTMFDSRLRLPLQRARRRRGLARGRYTFPILLNPRCLTLPGFATDCDAIYPSSPEEITNYMTSRYPTAVPEVFFRNQSTFGLAVLKP